MSDETSNTPDESVEEAAPAAPAAAADETAVVEAAADEVVADEVVADEVVADEAAVIEAEVAPEEKPKAKPRAKAKPKAKPKPKVKAEVKAEVEVEEVKEAPEAHDSDDESSSSSDDSSADAVDYQAELAAATARLLKPGKGARYAATGKRKRSVARVILTPGKGTFWINGRDLKTYFPRAFYQCEIMEPLELTGAAGVYDVRARIHGGGVTGQSHALRHGIAKALAEVDPAIRTQVKQKGMLKVDTRQVERKKAGLKKARKRPQFSKR